MDFCEAEEGSTSCRCGPYHVTIGDAPFGDAETNIVQCGLDDGLGAVAAAVARAL